MAESRGLRNNNPGNIEYGPFARAHGAIGSDGRFAIFPTANAGIAAIAALQGSYERQHGLTSVHDRISRWAPAFENNVNSYANAVAAGMGVSPDFSFSASDQDALSRFVAGMIQHENGSQPFSLDQIRTALAATPQEGGAGMAGPTRAAATGLDPSNPLNMLPATAPATLPQPPNPVSAAFEAVTANMAGVGGATPAGPLENAAVSRVQGPFAASIDADASRQQTGQLSRDFLIPLPDQVSTTPAPLALAGNAPALFGAPMPATGPFGAIKLRGRPAPNAPLGPGMRLRG